MGCASSSLLVIEDAEEKLSAGIVPAFIIVLPSSIQSSYSLCYPWDPLDLQDGAAWRTLSDRQLTVAARSADVASALKHEDYEGGREDGYPDGHT